MPKKELALKNATYLAAYLLIVWGFYRFLFKLPEEVEELLIKPVIWLIPVYLFLRREKAGVSSLGVTTKNLFPSIYIALALGILFALEGVIVNYLKYGSTNFAANVGQNAFIVSLALSTATAISEELVFRGYLFKRLWLALDSEWKANFLSSTIWAMVHIPIAIFWWDLSASSVFAFLIITTIFGIGSAFIYARTKNIASSIILHILWSWPITLFR